MLMEIVMLIMNCVFSSKFLNFHYNEKPLKKKQHILEIDEKNQLRGIRGNI